MGEYLHRSVHDNYAARHKGWYDNGGSMASVLSQEGAPAGERIARSKYQSAQVGAILGVGDGATAAPPAHRAGRKPLHEQQYASSHSKVGDVITGKAVGSPLQRGPKKVSGAREAGSEMHRLLYDGERLAEMDQQKQAAELAEMQARVRAQADAVRANLAAEAAAKLSISDGAPPAAAAPPSAAPDDAMRARVEHAYLTLLDALERTPRDESDGALLAPMPLLNAVQAALGPLRMGADAAGSLLALCDVQGKPTWEAFLDCVFDQPERVAPPAAPPAAAAADPRPAARAAPPEAPPAPAPAPPAPPNPDEVRAQILEARNSPQATRLAELMNGGSRAVHARRTASDLVAQGARPRY